MTDVRCPCVRHYFAPPHGVQDQFALPDESSAAEWAGDGLAPTGSCRPKSGRGAPAPKHHAGLRWNRPQKRRCQCLTSLSDGSKNQFELHSAWAPSAETPCQAASEQLKAQTITSVDCCWRLHLSSRIGPLTRSPCHRLGSADI